MSSTPLPAGSSFSPVSTAPLGDRLLTFLDEDGEDWSGERLLKLAARLGRAIPADAGEVVGVCSPSAAFVVAAVLALWREERQPLVLDPNLRQEPEAVLARYPGLFVLADSPHYPLANTIPVPLLASQDQVEPLEPAWPEGEQTAALFFTSGSSGEPKIVRKRAFQLYCQLEQELSWLEISTGLTVYSLVPPFHILGFVYGLFLPLLGQGRTAFSPGAPQAAWMDHLCRAEPHLVVGVPMHYRFLAKIPQGDFPRAFYFSSGAPLSPSTDEAFRQRTGQSIVQMYGSTETGGLAKRSGFGPWRPFPGLQWKIRAEDGRLMVRSPWQDMPQQWVTTDDVVQAEGEGFILLGRADSIIKVAGKRFSTNEVAAAARALPGVDRVAVVTYQRFGENAVSLFVTTQDGADPLTEQEIRRALAQTLALFKVPRSVHILEDLPRLSSGKVDSRALRRRAKSSDELTPADAAAPETPEHGNGS